MQTLPLPAVELLAAFRARLAELQFPLPGPTAAAAEQLRTASLAQLDDYLIPRREHLGAPLLAIVGGSTGAGKSTLVNSLVGRELTPASTLRPTTRSPLLVAAPADEKWFRSGPVLPGLTRSDAQTQSASGATVLGIATDPQVPEQLALLDTPDIDSVVAENRALARQLLEAGDLWLFVTTAARYADQVAWELLAEAAHRQLTVAVVLNRVPPGAAEPIREDLTRLLGQRGLAGTTIFTVEETTLTGGLIPASRLAPLTGWLRDLAGDRARREQVIRQSLVGAIDQLAEHAEDLARAKREQEAQVREWEAQIDRAFANAHRQILVGTGDGAWLRAEVLARWQDFVGTSDVFRTLEGWTEAVRDRVSAWFRGRPAPAQVQEELTSGLSTIVVNEVEQAWISGAARPGPALDHAQLRQEADQLVAAWQRELLELVRTAAPGKRQRARLVSLGLNTATVALMLVVFATTGGLVGAELAVAGGSAVVGQKLLETIFGEQAVRNLVRQGADLLSDRVSELTNRWAEQLRAPLAELNAGVGSEELSTWAKRLRGGAQ